jgi:aspartate/methionine/tyrosine aminotransferase
VQQQRVAVVPGQAFGPGGEGSVRASFPASMPGIERAVERIAQLVRNPHA